MSIYSEGDQVRLRIHDSIYPATITRVCDYVEHHGDGTVCQQYEADVQFPNETVHDGLISECMIQGYASEASKGNDDKTVSLLWRVETYAEEDRGDVEAVEVEEHAGAWWQPSRQMWIYPGEHGFYNYYTSEEEALREALDMLRGDVASDSARIAEYERRLTDGPPNTPGMFETWRYRIWGGHLWRRKHFTLDEQGHSYPEWEDMGAINEEGYVGDGARMPQPYSREEREN